MPRRFIVPIVTVKALRKQTHRQLSDGGENCLAPLIVEDPGMVFASTWPTATSADTKESRKRRFFARIMPSLSAPSR